MTKNPLNFYDMPADSTIVKTTTENLTKTSSDSHGVSCFVVDWWWVFILLAIIAYFGYTNKKWVIKIYRKFYIKFLIKMDKFIIIYSSWDALLGEERYDQLIIECDEADKNNEISRDERAKINSYREKAENAKKHKQVEALLNDIENQIKGNHLSDAIGLIEKSKTYLKTYALKERKFSDRISELENQIKNIKLDQFERGVREAVENKDYEYLVRAFSTNNITTEGFSKKEISPVIMFVKNTWKNRITLFIKEGKIDDAINLVTYSQQYDVLKDDEFVGGVSDIVINKIKLLISDKINAYLPTAAKSIRDSYANFLPSPVLREINKSIEICENSKPAKIKDYLSKALDAAKKGLFVDAWSEYKKAKDLQGGELTEAKNKIELLEKENQIRLNQQKYNQLIENIEAEIEKQNDASAFEYAQQAELIDVEDKSKLQGLIEKIKKIRKANEDEKMFFKKESIVLATCDGEAYFNVPKKENHGEDADPYVNVNPERRWGVISVFDGMGGAGARKYKHANTGEEHTSAWWASRYVKEAVEDIMLSRPIGENPISYLENHLKDKIVSKLNEVVKNFPAANAPLLTKMMRKLPTTMALCTYIIEDKDILINCYWSGDSRIYMFDKNKIYFLTKDDADALDGDPFSPANMDLAMNNTICQDRDFKINKSTIKVPYSSNNPIVLIAATDGCFGYFKNPIEFEYTIRRCLSDSTNLVEWLPLIKRAIIDNIQQDDFSMALVEIGDDNFNNFKEKLTSCLHSTLFEEYYSWRNSNKKLQESVLSEIAKKDEKILSSKKEIDNAKEAIAKIDEHIAKSSFLEEYDGYDSFKQKLLDKKESICQDLTRFVKNMEKLSHERNILKEKLDAIQLQSDSQNNEWYAKYKETFEIVNPLESVE